MSKRNMTYQEFADSIIQDCERAHDNGNPAAWWDIVLFCEQSNLAKPAWVRDLLVKHAREQGKPTSEKKQRGRPSNHRADMHIYSSVEYWREQQYRNNRYPRGRKFSQDQAFEKVQKELLEERSLSLTAEAVAKAYYRGKKLVHSRHFRDALVGPISATFYGIQ